ncbi:putative peptidyl-tRNA hydrolase PTRHD1 [Tubulanus polymorphus]|uniref:putative peptidyl-tRNA hydrolase PTRHD1 n=1 Tax=Tubulanus polymorphus TaxID=672921 RepID=UPI003DA1E0F1
MAAPTIVQYVIVRSDLISVLKWPTGAVIAQACHACSAVIHLFHDDPKTQEYLNDLDRMHKVILQVPDEEKLKNVAKNLTEGKIDHKLWIEQPENIATCLVTKPYLKTDVQQYFKGLKLFK